MNLMVETWSKNEPLGLGIVDESISRILRQQLSELALTDAEEVAKVYDANSHVPIWNEDVVARAQSYLKRSYLLSRQIGNSEDHNTAFLVEGGSTLVIPINDLIDRINLFTPMASLIQTLKYAMDPSNPDHEFALAILNEEDFFIESRVKFLRFIDEIKAILDAVRQGDVRLFFFITDRERCLHEAFSNLTELTQCLVEVSPAIFAAGTANKDDVISLLELMVPLLPVFNDIAECIRSLGRDAFDPSFADMIHSDNEHMINGFYVAMTQLMEK